MLVLVADKQIAGETDSLSNLPLGYQAFEVTRQPLDNLWFDGTSVLVKPTKPSDRHVWQDNQWVIPDIFVPTVETPEAILELIASVRKAKNIKELSNLVADTLEAIAGIPNSATGN